MDNRILWDIIDGLRDELNIAQDGITDLNDVVKDLQAEAIEQIRDNKRLNAEIELDEGVILARNEEVDDLKAEIKELKADNVRLQEVNESMYESMKIVRAECWCGGK